EELAEIQAGSPDLWQKVLAVLRAGDALRFREVPLTQDAHAMLIDRRQKQREVAIVLQFAKLVEKQFRELRRELHHV
ncbi:MAG: hypothetical protein AAF975_09400, partial [Spirochaetota bacterium]